MYNTDLPTRAELPSTGQLLRSTGLAALVAAGLLVTTILPAEYGIDATGLGRLLGLTQMGEIKNSLSGEAQADDVSPSVERRSTAPAPVAVAAPAAQPQTTAEDVVPVREHTVTIMLKPGAAAEIKLTMQKDARVRYEWSSAGGAVNYDAHGDPVGAPKDFYHGYGKGRNETAQAGTLQAAFDGKHGWFWRNRSPANVTVTLKTRGEYGQIERML